jgi:RimJ/RimL family protein N-acetyltransferase
MIISGHKSILRDWQSGDLDRYAYWLRPGHKWQKLDGPYYPPLSEARIGEMIKRVRTGIETQNWDIPRISLVIADASSGDLIGRVSWYWQSQETDWLSVGIGIFDPTYWRQGIGYEALGLWSDYLFQTMPLIVRLDLRTWSGNKGMMRLAEKLGYVEEARFRMARIVNGEYFDGMGYGVLRSEWVARYPNGFVAHLKDYDG